jgi:hypothetical protein
VSTGVFFESLVCQLRASASKACRLPVADVDSAWLQEDDECRMPLPVVFYVLFIEFIGYTVLAVYLSHVLPDSNGVRDPPFYFLRGEFWRPRKYKSWTISQKQEGGAPAPLHVDEDVEAEATRMRRRLGDQNGQIVWENGRDGSPGTVEGTNGANGVGQLPAIEVYGLQRKFRGASAREPFWAVCDSWFQIPRHQLFCLLGPNGAGASPAVYVSFPKEGQVTRHASFLGTPLGPKKLHFCCRLPRVLQTHWASRLAPRI